MTGSPFGKRRSMMTRLAAAVVGVALVVALGSCLRIRTTGTPWGPSARSGETIATLMTRLEPYVPTLNRNPGNDRYGIGLLLHSAKDPAIRRFVPIASGLRASSLGLARITAVDGDRIWFDAPEEGAYDTRTGELLLADRIGSNLSIVPPKRSATPADLATGDRALLLMLTAGGYVSPTRWLGVLSEAEIDQGFRPGFKPSAGYPLERSKEPRRLLVAEIEGVGADPRIRGLERLPGDGMLNAAFVRIARGGEILSLSGGGFLLVHETKPARAGTLVVSRVDRAGKIVWTTDTGIGELREILPDPETPALIGDRPRVPDQVPEPILVVVDAGTGRLVVQSLWLQ
jgi:hypothetical protein